MTELTTFKVDGKQLNPRLNLKMLSPAALKARPLSISSISSAASSNSSSSAHSTSSSSGVQSSLSAIRDDGFEDDLTSTSSGRTSNYNHHRPSFNASTPNKQHENQHFLQQQHQGRLEEYQIVARNRLSARLNSSANTSADISNQNCQSEIADDETYQSCGEDFNTTTTTTASTASNFDDCGLSTTSSSIIHHEIQRLEFDKISLADAKQQYRKSLLLEHKQIQQQQQQNIHLLNSNHHLGQSKIQCLLSSSPKICHIGTSPQGLNTGSVSSSSTTSLNKQTKLDDRTVNIVGHMPTKSQGYWDSNLSITQRVVTEIIETERTYVDDLEQIVTGYICYLRNVLKQQKQYRQQQQSHRVDIERSKYEQTSENNLDPMVNQRKATIVTTSNKTIDEDEKSIIVFDDDATSVTNEVEEYDEDVDNDQDAIVKDTKTMHDIVKIIKDDQHNLNHKSQCDSEVAVITASHIKKLFSNLEDIYKFNKDLLFRLEECYLNPSLVAECFVENSSGFEIYTHYCTMYPEVVSTLTELMANQASAQLLKERQNELNQGLPLGAYLLKPVQRILKYHILFQSLIKHTVNDDTIGEKDRQLINEAFSVMTNVACHINAMKKRHEHAIRVQEVQGLLSGWNGPDLTTLGELILEDTFKLYSKSKTSRHLFLFDNIVLMTKKKRDGSLCYKGHIECSNLMLIENIEGQPLVFSVVPFDNPKALCPFQAKNLDKKRDWCLQMKEVIIKSFDVKIPIHVRDILMSLTNSGTSVDNSSTSKETSRALRAPNYLEKKRAKQDKRR